MLNEVSVKVINLQHRSDRRLECINELESLKYNFEEKSIFFPAKYIPELGARGCALSHAMAMADFLCNENKPFLMILEDDFTVRDPESFSTIINQILQFSNFWDVYLLGHNQAVPVSATQLPQVVKVINSQTTSGYIVGRNYACKLIETFFRSAEYLSLYNDLPSPNKELARHSICCDMLWKELQIKNRFWARLPSDIYQRQSHSDIENRVVDYKV
jgi:glycosyl transferase, family 25